MFFLIGLKLIPFRRRVTAAKRDILERPVSRVLSPPQNAADDDHFSSPDVAVGIVSGLPGNLDERERSCPFGLFPYLTLLRVEIASFHPSRPFGTEDSSLWL